MRVRRGLLFWGLFLIPLGGISLLVRAGILDPEQLPEVWRLWPLVLIGIGIAIVMARSRTAVVGTTLVALVLGSLGGVALASGPGWLGAFGDCGRQTGTSDQRLDRSGTFDGPASVSVNLRCGTVSMTTVATPDWRIAASYRGAAPIVEIATNRVGIRTSDDARVRRNDWRVAVPAGLTNSVSVTANAASAVLDLSDAHLSKLDAVMNAGDLRVDATRGAIDRVDLAINAGRIRLGLGPTGMQGSLSVNAGAIDLCVPSDAGLFLTVTDQLTFAHNLATRGLTKAGSTWTRAAAGGPMVSLAVTGNAASFTLNPDGGCR